jgi:hypothetical protein
MHTLCSVEATRSYSPRAAGSACSAGGPLKPRSASSVNACSGSARASAARSCSKRCRISWAARRVKVIARI